MEFLNITDGFFSTEPLDINSTLLPYNESNFPMTPCPSLNKNIVSLLTQILYALVCVVGLLGNTLVIYVVLRFSKMQTVTNMYIVNLAIADECFLIGIPFLITTMNLETWIFGDVMCKIYMVTTSINQFTSSIFLFIMSADRYVAVCHPISSPKMRTPFISRVVSLIAWATSAIIMVPVFVYTKTIRSDKSISCNIIWPESNNNPQKTFTLYAFILGFAIPLAMILIFYCLVIRKLQTVGPKNKSKEKKRSHRKVTKLVLTVITVYILCWLPYWILQMALIFGPADQDNQCRSRTVIFLFLLAGCLSYSNSAMNPILYAFLSDNFKKSFLKACTCAAGKERRAGESRSMDFTIEQKLSATEDAEDIELMVNATLHMENSVFPRRHQKPASERLRACSRGTTGLCPTSGNDEDGEAGPLVSRADHSTSAITMTSRSNITVSTDTNSKEINNKDSVLKNGVLMTLHPTQV